jgi:hypothetical protein
MGRAKTNPVKMGPITQFTVLNGKLVHVLESWLDDRYQPCEEERATKMLDKEGFIYPLGWLRERWQVDVYI